MIIDAHAHLGQRPVGDIESHLRMMDKSGVDRTIFVAGDNVDPVKLADFIRGHEPLISVSPLNDIVESAFTEHPSRCYGFFTVDPTIHEVADVTNALRSGFSGIKFNPLVHQVDFRNPLVEELMHLSRRHGFPIYTHITLNPAASIETLRDVIRRTEPVLILGHMGFASGDGAAVELALDFDRVYLETSVGSFLAIKEATRILGAQKIVFGSESPAHHQAVELMKIRSLELRKSDEDAILGNNILRILSGAEVLQAQQ